VDYEKKKVDGLEKQRKKEILEPNSTDGSKHAIQITQM
jgi:hypothetical protein